MKNQNKPSLAATVLSDYMNGKFSPQNLDKAASRQRLSLEFAQHIPAPSQDGLWSNFAEKLYITAAEGYDSKEIEIIKSIADDLGEINKNSKQEIILVPALEA